MYPSLFLLLILLLIILSYFFSGAETSLTSINTARIHDLENKGNKKARTISILNKNKSRILGVILLGNTLVNTTASALATTLFVDFFHNDGIGATISSIVMTFVILLFAEVLPKTYAIRNPEKVALFSAPIIKKIGFTLYPIINFIQTTVDLILKILSLNKDKEVISATDAIRNLVSFHKNDKTMLKQDIEMLNSVLDLAETEISNIMIHRKDMEAINIDLDKEEIIQNILDAKHTNIPLWKNDVDNIEGIINVHDLIIELRKQQSYQNIDLEKITRKPIFVPDTTPLSIQLYNFRMNENNFAVVVDEYGSLQGIVTLSDILEEIVGDIHYDDKGSIKKLDDGNYSIDSKVSVRDINRKLQWELPDKDASTLAGIIIHAIERIPEVEEEFDLFGVKFKILEKKGNFITRIRGSLITQENGENNT
ncbi:MAG: DUF21 domain-containing protein [Rickettsiaceae bacterium H1]|nr:DUF21 domain-containing protein [Rickettsiaceae bacterium H1]